MARRLVGSATVVFLLFALSAPLAGGQAGGSTGAITVTVLDPRNNVVPGAELELRDLATNNVRRGVTQAVGNYRFVSLPLGTYSLSITMPGFETQVFNSVAVQAAQTTDLRATLRLGATAEMVEVVGEAAPLVNTTTNMIGTTLTTKQIEDLPMQGRSITQLTQLMAGYTGTWNGLPTAAQGNNLDGVVASTSRMKFGGNATPTVAVRLENIQEMTVQTDALDMNQGFGNSSMQLNFVTRRGSNQFHGRLFEDFRNAALNANSWTNNARGLARPPLILNDFGGGLGGPILRDKLFFFGSFATTKQPSAQDTTAPILTSDAQSGLFRYAANPAGVNVLQLAANNGFPRAVHPLTASQLGKINSAREFGRVVSTADPNINNLAWNYSRATTIYYPTLRLDYNTTQNVRMNFSFNQQKYLQVNGDAPDLPGPEFTKLTAADTRNLSYTLGYGLDWALSPTIMNQFRGGFLYYAAWFSDGFDESQHLRLPHVTWGTGGGYARSGLSYPGPNSRYFPNFNAQNTVSWQTGAHALNFGFSYWREQDHYWDPPGGWPGYSLDITTNDPANQMFNTTTFPGATATELTRARNLYALLVGRVSSVSGRYGYETKLGDYKNDGISRAVLNELQSQWGLFFQDSWRMRPSLTLNYGLRWDFVGDNHDVAKQYHSGTPEDVFGPSGVNNLFKPGSLQGNMNPILSTRPHPYKPWNVTPQPAIGFAWHPRGGDGFLGRLLGEDTVFRGGYSFRRFVPPQQFFWNYASNYGAFYYQQFRLDPGIDFAPGSLTLGNNPSFGGDPLPPFTKTPATYQASAPLSDFTFRTGTRINGFASDIKQPYTQSWNFGIQRRLGSSRVLELRYNGNRTSNQWIATNINEVNVFAARPGEDSFVTQFTKAQQNLAINRASGRGNSFINNDLPGQHALPVFQAAFAGASNAQGFGNASFVQWLDQGEAGRLAYSLAGAGAEGARYFCNLVGAGFRPCATNLGYTGAGAGYPINYFQANPFKTGEGAGYLDSVGYITYNALQVEFRQQPWHGLQFNTNYTWSKNLGIESGTDWEALYPAFTLRDLRKSYLPTGFDRRHVFHFSPMYDLPFGYGRMFANWGGFMDKIVGGWTLSSIVTVQTGTPFRLTSGYQTFNQIGDSGVVLNGVTRSQLQDSIGAYRVGQAAYGGLVDFVQILDPKYFVGLRGEGGANPTYIKPATTPGTFGEQVVLYGPRQTFVDIAVSKNIPITERVRFKFQAEFLNAFNHPVFGNPVAPGTSVAAILGSGFGITTGTIGPNMVGTQTVSGGTLSRQIQLRLNLEF